MLLWGHYSVSSAFRGIQIQAILKRKRPYLIIKIHLQVVLAAMAPPTIGPISNAKADTMETFATYLVYLSGGTSSIMRIVEREKQPPPPIPWNARKTILGAES